MSWAAHRAPGPGDRRAAVGALLWLAPLLAVLLVIGFAAVRRQQPASITATLARGGRPAAPAFTLPRFEGGAVSLDALRGRYVVMNFWASWCIPCKDEAPLLERIWQEYRDRGVVVLGVNIQDLEGEAKRFIAETKATYPQVRDREGGVARAYGTIGVPETFFIDREGRIARKFSGAAVEWAVWEDAVETLLGAR